VDDGTQLDIANANELIQAMNSFGADTSALSDIGADATPGVSEMCPLTAYHPLSDKAI